MGGSNPLTKVSFSTVEHPTMPHLLFSVLLSVMRYLFIQSLAIGLFQTLPVVGAFDMSVNTNVSRHSIVIIFSVSRSVSAGRVSKDICSLCRSS